VVRPAWRDELASLLPRPAERGIIARGLGRSYGDAAQNAGGVVVDTTAVDGLELDEQAGLVRADAGASLDKIMRVIVPRGFFVPVTPGTRYVTVGGAIAADIHGKNHHRTGTFGQHVTSIRLALADGSVVEIGPDRDPDLFWATVGGMGLTGIIVDATFRCPRIETSRLLVDTDRAGDLDEVMSLIVEGDAGYDYSVAWIDLMAGGRRLGRSVLTRGRFATLDELDTAPADDPLAYDPHLLAAAPPGIPSGLLNKASVRAFNELWFRKAPASRQGEVQSIPTFFHPLDMVDKWNRLYGGRGFLQWQFVVPFGAEGTLRTLVERLSAVGCTSFLAVLKTFGEQNPGPLSFPMAGWTLALDIPVGGHGLAGLLDRLDDLVVAAGGRIYLAKDSRMRAELLPAMYPRLDAWRATRHRVDPDGVWRSDLSRRLALG